MWQLLEQLETEDADVRAANVPLLKLVLRVLDSFAAQAGGNTAHIRTTEELIACAQAILEGLSHEQSRCQRRPRPCCLPLEGHLCRRVPKRGCTDSPPARRTTRVEPVSSPPPPLGSSPPPQHGPHPAYTQFPAFPIWLHVYVPDVDATYRRALAAGGVSVQEPVQKGDPDRRGGVKDPAGNTWWIATQMG